MLAEREEADLPHVFSFRRSLGELRRSEAHVEILHLPLGVQRLMPRIYAHEVSSRYELQPVISCDLVHDHGGI